MIQQMHQAYPENVSTIEESDMNKSKKRERKLNIFYIDIGLCSRLNVWHNKKSELQSNRTSAMVGIGRHSELEFQPSRP